MIKPISLGQNQSLNFTAKSTDELYSQFVKNRAAKAEKQDVVEVVKEVPKKKKGLFGNVSNLLKFKNSALGITGGAAKGLVFGNIAAWSGALVAKNIIKADQKILPTLKGIGGDLIHLVGAAMKGIGSLWKEGGKALLNGVKNLPSNFMKYCKEQAADKKSAKFIAPIAIAIGAVTSAVNILSGVINANKKNAELDHKLGASH